MKARWLIFAAPVAVFAVALYLWRTDFFAPPLDPAGKVAIAASPTLSPALVFVARDRGFFAWAGVDATIKEYPTGKATTEAMLKGETDLSASTEFLAARLSFARKDLRLLGTTAFVHEMKLIGLKERGIVDPASLKGKRVGVKLGTNGEYFLARLLALHGMERDDIAWVDLQPQAMADALDQDAVDAILVWPPFVQAISARFAGRVAVFDGQPGQDYYYLILARQDWLASHGKLAERVMLALKRAETWMAEHPEEAEAYLVKKFAIDPAAKAEALDGYRYAVTLPQSLLAALETESRWLEAQGNKGTRMANALDLIAFEPLQQAAPAAVTIVRGTPE